MFTEHTILIQQNACRFTQASTIPKPRHVRSVSLRGSQPSAAGTLFLLLVPPVHPIVHNYHYSCVFCYLTMRKSFQLRHTRRSTVSLHWRLSANTPLALPRPMHHTFYPICGSLSLVLVLRVAHNVLTYSMVTHCTAS